MNSKKFPRIFSKRVLWVALPLFLAAVIAIGFGIKAMLDSPPERGDEKKELSYEAWCEGETVNADRGEHFTLTVTLKNNSGEDYTYEGSYSELKPEIVLVSEDGNFKIEHDDMPFTNDFAKHIFRHGDTRTILFYFTVPENAPTGSYRAEMTFKGDCSSQENVLRIA